YYVTPPPTSGTIVVRKQVGGANADPQPFTFKGNISYTADHTFTLSAGSNNPASMTFYRAATGPVEEPWSFAELPLAGWRLAGLSCAAAGASTTATDPGTGTASVRLAAGDTVTCTYTDALQPPPAGLTIAKRTIGGTGSFDFSISGEGQNEHETIT